MHGTLKITYMAVKSNFQQVLLKTLIPTMNTLKHMAVLNIIKTDGKCTSEAKREELELIRRRFNQLCIKKLNTRTNIKKVSSARGDPWV